MKKHPELTAITKANLKNTFWELYKEKPLSQITVKEICDKSQYNRSTFYAYYKDIYDILDQIEDELLEELKIILGNKTLLFFSSKEFVSKMTDIYSTKGEQLYYLLRNGSNSSFLGKYKNLIKSIVFSTINDNDNDYDGYNLEFELLFEFMISSVIASLSYWYPRRDEMKIDEFVEFIYSIAKNGPIYQLKTLLSK